MLIAFRDLKDTENEYRQLHKWCSNKFVYEWFEQRKLSYDEIVDKYKTKLKEKKQELFIIKADDIDIGLVQIYKFDNDIEIDVDGNVYEYDLFIGEEEYLDKGIGKEGAEITIDFLNDNDLNKSLITCKNGECIYDCTE